MSDTYDPNYKPQAVYIQLGVKTVVIGPDGRILLLRRSDKVSDPHTWGFPGGGVDKDEDPAVAAVREVAEEAKINVRNPKPFASYVHTGQDVTIIGYTAQADSTEVELNWENDEARWVTHKELRDFDLPDLHAKFRDEFLALGQ